MLLQAMHNIVGNSVAFFLSQFFTKSADELACASQGERDSEAQHVPAGAHSGKSRARLPQTNRQRTANISKSPPPASGAIDLVCKRGSQTPETIEWTVPHTGVETGPAGRRVVMATCVGVAVSVLTWLALSYFVWCIRSGNGEHLFRRRRFFLK